MQITFENYKHLLVRIDQIDEGFRYKYYNEVQEKKFLQEHIKSLQSEIRFLRRQVLEQKNGQI